MTCSSCGTATPDGARFCPTCGHTLVARPDERRVATVVFADLVGFTTFSESADPEHVKNLVDTCFERLVADVTAYGGQVDKIVGDAVVALFGAPVAHEDDAERAVRAALQMQQTLAALRKQHGIAVEMRIGVNTGEVLVGALRAGGDYTAMGDVVNTASRLQTAAQPGEVLVGPTTHAATAAAVEYEALGPIAVKGRDEPVEVWGARSAVARPGRRRLRSRTRLVGRDAELSLLRQTIAAATTRRRSHYVLVLGEAGVGKRRLVVASSDEARREHGATVLGGQCVPYGEANAWGPLGDAIRHACGIDASDPIELARDRARARVAATLDLEPTDAEADRIAAGLLFLAGHLEVVQDVDPTRARDDALRSLLAFFEGLAGRGPVLLVVTDLHWADDAVLDAMDRLLTRLRSLPFVVMATARPEIDARWTLGSGHHELTRVHLDPLDRAGTAALVSALLDAPVDPALAAALHERSGGNPFFVEELVALLRESAGAGPDALPATSADAAAAVADRLGRLPATLRGLVAARLDALPAAERFVLEDAAVVGPRGSVDAVRALAASPREGDAVELLERLTDRDLLALDDGEYRFRSEVIRDVAYGTLTKAERARRHATLAAWLEQPGRGCEVDDNAEEIAHHFATAAELAGELGAIDGVPADVQARAVAALERAAARAEHVETWNVSSRLFDRALALQTADDAVRWRLLLGHARALANKHELVEARADCERVLEAAARAGDDRMHASALTLIAQIEQRAGDLAASNATYEQATAAWRVLDDPTGTATALRGWGMTRIFRGELTAAEALTTEALASFRAQHNRRGEAWALQNLAWVAFLRGDSEVAERRLDESARTFGDIGDWGGLNWAIGLLGWVRLLQGRLGEAEQLARLVLGEARATGSRWAEGITTVLLACVSMWTGRIDDAVTFATEARSLFGELEDRWGSFQACFPLMRAVLVRGQVDEAFALVPEARRLAELVGDRNLLVLADLNGVSMATQIGDSERALRYASGMTEDESIGFGERHASCGLALLQSGRVDEAIAQLELARELAIEDSWLAAVAGPLGLAYAAASRGSDVQSLAEIARGLPTGSYLDRLQLSWASGLALAQQGDGERARVELDDAVAAADATGSLVDQAVARLARAQALEALGASDATAARAEARTRLDALGLPATGWETAFGLAARGS